MLRVMNYILTQRHDLHSLIDLEMQQLKREKEKKDAETDEWHGFIGEDDEEGDRGGAMLNNVARLFRQYTASAPYFQFTYLEQDTLTYFFTALNRHAVPWKIEYANENARPIEPSEVKNMQERCFYASAGGGAGGGVEKVWEELGIRHPLDIFSTLFLWNDVRRDVSLFLQALLLHAIEIYNSRSEHHMMLDPFQVVSSLIQNASVVFPARIMLRLPIVDESSSPSPEEKAMVFRVRQCITETFHTASSRIRGYDDVYLRRRPELLQARKEGKQYLTPLFLTNVFCVEGLAEDQED